MANYARVEHKKDVTKPKVTLSYYVTQESGEFYINLKIPIIATLAETVPAKEIPQVDKNYRDLRISENGEPIFNLYEGGSISTVLTVLKSNDSAGGSKINFQADGGSKIPGTGELESN